MKYNLSSIVQYDQPNELKYFIQDYNENSEESIPLYNIELGNIETIRDYAFYYNGYLNTLIIPNSVKYIGRCAFAYTSNLQPYFKGTVAEWNSIEFGEDWNEHSTFVDVYCSDGVVRTEEPS